jgi:hypothetical protein
MRARLRAARRLVPLRVLLPAGPVAERKRLPNPRAPAAFPVQVDTPVPILGSQ